jgi:hypothetical protein
MTMAVEIVMSSPIPRSGYTGPLGGPGQGGHAQGDWFIRWGMDLGAKAGTEVRAAFDGHITKYVPPPKPTEKVYGAQFSIRSDGDVIGAWYTHIAPSREFKLGDVIKKGTLLGTVMIEHLHLALVEIIQERKTGLNLYEWFKTMAIGGSEIVVTLNRNGQAPSVRTK